MELHSMARGLKIWLSQDEPPTFVLNSFNFYANKNWFKTEQILEIWLKQSHVVLIIYSMWLLQLPLK